jgi:hypothetical protein
VSSHPSSLRDTSPVNARDRALCRQRPTTEDVGRHGPQLSLSGDQAPSTRRVIRVSSHPSSLRDTRR